MSNTFFRRFNALHNFQCVRHMSFKITQVDTIKTLSKADRIKRLNFENKYLFGSSIKKKKKVHDPVEHLEVEEVMNSDDKSSEIYWTCHHVSEIQDLTKPLKKSKKSKKKKSEENTTKFDIMPTASPLNETVQPKLVEAENNDNLPEREIPFKTIKEFRAILNFPLVLSESKTIYGIDKFDRLESSIYLPSVTKVLQATMTEPQRLALVRWKSQKIAELGLEGFAIMQQCKKNTYNSKYSCVHDFMILAQLSRGKDFHRSLQSYFMGETIEMSAEMAVVWKSIEPLLGNFKTPAMFTEEKVEHPFLKYQGFVDCVSFHNSSLCVIEWKRSERPKRKLSVTYDAPIQLCSYLGALNASREEFQANPIRSGVVAVAYTDGQQADLFELNEKDLNKYWKLWLHRLQDYWVRYKNNTLPGPI